MFTSAPPEDVAGAVADTMPSPYCPGRTIASCPSEAARELEREILVQAERGKTQEEIEAGLVARFGEEVMGADHDAGLFLGAFGVGVVALILVVFGVRGALRRRAAPQAAGSAEGALSPVDLDRLEAALDEVEEF